MRGQNMQIKPSVYSTAFTVLICPGQKSAARSLIELIRKMLIMIFCLVFFRMKLQELLKHPFWTQVRKEQEDPEFYEHNEDEYLDGKNPREAFGSACSRCVCI